MATRTDFDRLVGGLGEDQQKYMQNWLQSNNPTQGQMDNFANNPGDFLSGIGWTGSSTKQVVPVKGNLPGGVTVLNDPDPTGQVSGGTGMVIPPSGGGNGTTILNPEQALQSTDNPYFNLFRTGFNSTVGEEGFIPFFDFDNSGILDFSDFLNLSTRISDGQSPFVFQSPLDSQPVDQPGGVPFTLQDIVNSIPGYQGPSLEQIQSIIPGYQGPTLQDIQGVIPGYQGPTLEQIQSILPGYQGPTLGDIQSVFDPRLGNIGSDIQKLLDPEGILFGDKGFGGVIPTINDLLGGNTAIQTDISGIGDRLGTIEGLLNQTPDYQPFIEDFWGGLRDLMSEMPEGATFTPGEGGSIVVDPGNGGEPFEFTPPEMGDIVDNRAVFRDSLNDLLLGNTGANNLLADRYVSALDAPNPYAEVQDSVLGEIMRQIDADAEQGRERLLNQYAVTNKLDMPVFKEQLQDYEGDVLNAKGNARINFGLQQAGAEEGIRRGRLQDLSGYQQQNVVNLAEALRNSITERAGEVGLQQNVYNNALQNFLNTVNQNNAVTTTQYGFTDDGTRMALGLLGNGMGQSAATGAANIFGNIQNNNDAGFNNFLNLLMQFGQ